MVTVNKKIALNTGTATFELMGLSTDTKPTGTFSGYNVGVNSVFLELDTGTLYYFNGSEWEEMSMSGGGAGLPAVTSEDNGKVLGVVNGAWDKTDGDNDFVVTGTLLVDTTTSPITIGISSLDKEYADINDAVLAGKNVRLVASDAYDNAIEADASLASPGLEAVLFSGVMRMPDRFYALTVMVGEGDEGTEATVDTFPLLESDYSPLIVPGTISGTTATSTEETPLADIYAAFGEGRPIYFEADVGNGRGRFQCTSVELNAGDYTVIYAAPMIAGGKPGVFEIKFSGSDTTGAATLAMSS